MLIGQANAADAIQPCGKSNLHVLPSGQVPPNPSEMLGSRSMAHLLEQLSSQYDIVLIDTPPLLPVTDAAILATITGGALVVASACTLHRQQLAEGLGSPEDVGARVLGVVLNRIEHEQGDAYPYYDYSPAPVTGSRADSRRRQTRSGGSGSAVKRAGRAGIRPESSMSEPSSSVETGRATVG